MATALVIGDMVGSGDGVGVLNRRLGGERRDRGCVRRYLGVFWNDVNTTHWLAAVAAVWLFTFVNIIGARETGWAQVVTTVLKFVPLAAIGIVSPG
jgi:amino acid transporter